MTSGQRERLERGLALFDFDGTLIPWDTQVLFADFVLRKEGWRRAHLALFAVLAPFAAILGDEGMKRVFLSYLWLVKPDQLALWVDEFVSGEIAGACYPEMLERLEAHRAAGHLTVLASASPEFYVRRVGEQLGFDLALGTPVETSSSIRLFPDLNNHKGRAKVRRLARVLGEPPGGAWPRSHGYTDSRADLPMMALCEKGTVVNPSAALEAVAREHGWESLRFPTPWRGRWGRALAFASRAAGLSRFPAGRRRA